MKDDLKKSRVEDGQVENADRQVAEASRTEDTDESRESAVKELIVGKIWRFIFGFYIPISFIEN